ncbi:NHP2-like protein 1 [Bonamia ostreae]|uniref:H/ACA ribonucleoprotein complex subunit 2 n=1 Tax=Bonamia ostreae TaxID=126728 RepID=A0ABV2AI07_9EUKA
MSEVNSRAFPLADEELKKKLLELVQSSHQYKQVKRGANESTKALNRGQAEIIVMAADTDPIEIVMHLPLLCEDKNVPYVFVSSKMALGRACGLSRSLIACAILKDEDGNLQNQLNSTKRKIEQLMI